MFDFEPTAEQTMLIDWVRRFAQDDLRAAAHDADEAAQLPEGLVQKGWEMGVLQASIPESYGGFGDRSAVTGVLAAEEMAWGDLAGTLAIMTPGLFALPILLAGNEQQKQDILPGVVDGAWRPLTAALVERSFDFDPNRLATQAEPIEDGYQIHGEKISVPFADQAEAMLVYAALDGATQAFILPGDMPGLEVRGRDRWMGINGLPTYTVRLDNVRVPSASRLGGENGHDFAPILDSARAAMAAMGLGVARAAFEYSRDYAKEREAFGVKIAQKQAIAFMLAEMATELEAIRLLTWEAAWKIDQGESCSSKHTYLALTGAIDAAMMITDRAVQILGGHGYIREHPVELWMRNGRGIASLTGLAMV